MRFLLWVALVGLAFLSPARADITLYNFSGTPDVGTVVTQRDIYGDSIDAYSGNIVLSAGVYYLIGESHRAGFRVGTAGTASGISVYSSPDLVNWTPRGYLIDPSDPNWTDCSSSISFQFAGCYRPHMVQHPITLKWILWIEVPQLTNNAAVAICDTPLGPCTRQTNPSRTVSGAGQMGDTYLFCCVSGAAYLSYSSGTGAGRPTYIDKLDANFTNPDGVNSIQAIASGDGEGNVLFTDGSFFYLMISAGTYSPAEAIYASSATILGTYSAPTSININSCLTQAASVNVITAGGHTTYLYLGDSFIGYTNEGLANHFWESLGVSGGTITWPGGFSGGCSRSITVLGVTPTSPASPWPSVDQSNYSAKDQFLQNCDITNSAWWLQTFVPSVARLNTVGMPLGQNNHATPSCTNFAPSCASPDGSLEADLVTIDGSNNPSGTLATVTIPVANLKWAPEWTMLTYNQTLTPGSKYGVLLKPTGNSVGCFSFSRDDPGSSSYPAGLLRKSTNSGSTWTTQGLQSSLFSTYGATPVPFSGVAH